MEQDVEVKISSFANLASPDCPLALDNYQRPYVWGDKKISQLLNDLQDFLNTLTDVDPKINAMEQPQHYYMGALLIHQQETEQGGKRFVIDGQQRLTSLSILYWLLRGELPSHMQLSFRSTRSKANIQNAKRKMQVLLDGSSKNLIRNIQLFDRLRFTVISVKREDLAFTFFDTQNNRGVPLSGTDLLKAYHLRAITGDISTDIEKLQSHCAKRWEQVQLRGEKGKTSQGNDFAPELFHYYLWRGRNWSGNQVIELESQDELLSHFGEQSVSEKNNEISLYASGSNQWGKQLRLTTTNEYQLQPCIQSIGNNAAYLPMTLRQPISSGVGFFLYAEKYAALLNTLLHKPSDNVEVDAVQNFYIAVVQKLSGYLQSLYRLLWLAYFDRLGNQGLLRFVLWLDHRLGAIRLGQDDIRRETPLKFLRDEKRNLLDVICHAYRSEDILLHLQQKNVTDIYTQKGGWSTEISANRRVQERYASAVAGYYGIVELSHKANEIDAKVEQVLASKGVSHV